MRRTKTLFAVPIAGAFIAAVMLAQGSGGPSAAIAAQAPAQAPSAALPAAGEYQLDLNHASLTFKVRHMGLSNYIVRFNKFDATLNLDPANGAASSLNATVDTGSIDAFYSSDFKKTHPNSAFATWSEELARGPRYLNSDRFRQASFRSTRVELTGSQSAKVHGDLTIVGKTQPMTFDVKLVGSRSAPSGGAIGFEAVGSMDRSAFGISHLAGAVGNTVVIEFNGEFHRPGLPR